MVPSVYVSSTHYRQSDVWTAKSVSVAADRYILLSPVDGVVLVNTTILFWRSQVTLNLSVAATWDTVAGTDYTVAANRAGKDFYVYACIPVSGSTPTFKVSVNASAPSGYTTANSRKVGGFHCLCVAINHNTTLTAWTADTVIALGQTRKATVWDGFIYRCSARAGDFKTHATTEPNWASIAAEATIVDDQITWTKELHSLEGYVAGDILPLSVWDLTSEALSGNKGMVYLTSSGYWMDIYLQSGTGASTVSVYNATITHSRTPRDHTKDMFAVRKFLPIHHQFMEGALGSNRTAIAGGDPAASGGKSDAYGRRMVSNLGVEDCCGSHGQFLSDMITATSRYGAGGGYYDTTNPSPFFLAAYIDASGGDSGSSGRGVSHVKSCVSCM
jgi:hypothetical protein